MLAHYLGKNQPFYCLERAQVDTIEEIASFYISKIKTVQSTGPYYLGGFCGFGMIALEMARQLAAQGEEVAALFLFESYSPTGMVPRLSWKYMKLSYNKLVKWPSLNRKKYLKDELRQTAKALLFATIKRLTNKKLIKTLSGRIILVNHRPYDYSYSGKVLLFKASYPDIWVKDDPKMGWSGFFTGDVETVTIEGDHTDIFKVPGVVKMAKVMKSVIASRITYVACFFPLTLVL
jgi:thioesterase domain-containing protein